MKANWSVAVVYEDESTRQSAVAFCDGLVEKFWAECEFDVGWWSFDQLQASKSAGDASGKAAEADMIVFAARPEGEMPIGVGAWVDGWLGRRGEREGMLVGLFGHGAEPGEEMTEKQVYLRAIAHRCGMDYLTELPHTISRLFPDSPESISERVGTVTSILDEILHHHSPPPQTPA